MVDKIKRNHFYLIQEQQGVFIVGRALSQKPTQSGHVLMDLNIEWVPPERLKHRNVNTFNIMREATTADMMLYGP